MLCNIKHHGHIKFLSIEPLLEDMLLTKDDLDGINMVIVGGESDQSDPRTMKEEWVLPIRDLCVEMSIPFFFKQWGGLNSQKHANGRILDGRTWDEFPESRMG